MRDLYVFGILMDLKWWENEKYERKESLDYIFHSGFFFSTCPLAILFLASVVVSDLKSKESEETIGAGSLWYLPELSSWVKDREKKAKKHSAHCFPVLHSHLKIRISHVFFFLFFFFYIRCPRVSTAWPSLFLPLWDIWTAVAECVYYRGYDPDILFNTWPLSA